MERNTEMGNQIDAKREKGLFLVLGGLLGLSVVLVVAVIVVAINNTTRKGGGRYDVR